jgi:hypothetical protein
VTNKKCWLRKRLNITAGFENSKIEGLEFECIQQNIATAKDLYMRPLILETKNSLSGGSQLIKGKEHRPAEQLLGSIPNTAASQGFDREGEPEVKDFIKNVGVALVFSGSMGKRNKLDHSV